jgi:serine/threonine protein kinase
MVRQASPTSAKRFQKIPNRLANGKYSVDKKVGAGAFAEVYRAYNTAEPDEIVAAKFEQTDSGFNQLENEATLLQQLHRRPSQGLPVFHGFVKEENFNVLVMQPLGKTLQRHLQNCGGHFNVRTTALIADQILMRIEYLHSEGIIHRDIKPENFMFGNAKEGKQHHLYIIDFGLSQKYFDGGRHVEFKNYPEASGGNIDGTARYASINCHKGNRQSRRDDLESLGYILIYLLRGKLPWTDHDADDNVEKKDKFNKYMEMKEATSPSELCRDLPAAFEKYVTYCRQLGFKDRPDYRMLRQLFMDVRLEQSTPEKPIEDHSFEWFDGLNLGNIIPLQRQDFVQPDDPSGGMLANSVSAVPARRSRRGIGSFFCGGQMKTRD